MKGSSGEKEIAPPVRVVLESPHTYEECTKWKQTVTFDEGIQWMTVEFDPLCATTQPDDKLILYHDRSCNHLVSGFASFVVRIKR